MLTLSSLKKYAPSKRFIVLCSTIVAAIAFIATGIHLKNLRLDGLAKTADLTVVQNPNKSQSQKFLEADSDNDSLPDWQEALLGTDPQNTDSDSDGTTDGEEVKENRDPLKANTSPKQSQPNDKINPETIIKDQKAEEEYARLTPTERASRTFFSQYLATKKSDGTLSDTDKQNLLAGLLRDTNLTTATATRVFAVKDIQIVDDTTALNIPLLHAYGNAMADAMFVKAPHNLEPVLTTIQSALISQKPDELNKIDSTIAGYDQIIKNLLAIKVPASSSGLHVYLLNTFQSISDDLRTVKKIYSDAVSALQGFKKYSPDQQALVEGIRSLQAYLQTNGISFTEKESGYILMNIL